MPTESGRAEPTSESTHGAISIGVCSNARGTAPADDTDGTGASNRFFGVTRGDEDSDMDLPDAPLRTACGERPTGVPDPPEAACWVCSRRVAQFETYGIPPRIGRCPHCGAKPRSRALHRLVRERIAPRLRSGDRVLEIGPSRFSADHLIGADLFAPARCVAVDVRRRRHHRRLGASGRFVAASAAMLGFADGTFDFILCNNTLPYVREDRRALAEIARCLKREGVAMIDTHRGPGATRSADAHRREHPGLGEDWFAANGDAWVYGEDFCGRVREAGLEPVEIEPFPGAPDRFFTANGLKPRVRALFASRDPSGLRRFFGNRGAGRSGV